MLPCVCVVSLFRVGRVLFCCSGMPLVAPWALQVLDLTHFPEDDVAITRSQAVANVRAAMANGSTVALMYASSIHGSLYDLLNQVGNLHVDARLLCLLSTFGYYCPLHSSTM